jgi:hypothetical protein
LIEICHPGASSLCWSSCCFVRWPHCMERRWCSTHQKPAKSRCVPLIDNSGTLLKQ